MNLTRLDFVVKTRGNMDVVMMKSRRNLLLIEYIHHHGAQCVLNTRVRHIAMYRVCDAHQK